MDDPHACWFCGAPADVEPTRVKLHHPTTLAEAVVEVPSCARCRSIKLTTQRIGLGLFAFVLAIGGVCAYVLADRIVPGRDGRARGTAMGFVFWPVLAGAFVVDALLFVAFQWTTRRLCGLKNTDATRHPAVAAWVAQGYKLGERRS